MTTVMTGRMGNLVLNTNLLRIRHAGRVLSFESEGYKAIFTVKNDIRSRYTRMRHTNGNVITIHTMFDCQIVKKNGKVIEKRDFSPA